MRGSQWLRTTPQLSKYDMGGLRIMRNKYRCFSVLILLAAVLHFSIALSYAQQIDGSSERTKTVESLMEQARADGKIGNIKLLIDSLSKVIEIEPSYGEAYYERGGGRYILGENDDAIKDFTKAISLKYKVSESLSNRGMVYLVMRDYRKAKEDFDSSIELQPSSAAYANRAGYYIMALKDYQSAIRDGRQAISLDAKNANAFYNLASAYIGAGDTRSGVNYLERACTLGHQGACNVMRQRFGR
jgi:tetratricopeptide (TPR) repeat protein